MNLKDQIKPVCPSDLPDEAAITSRWGGWQPGDPAKVSIICLAFNQERYVQDAICGFLIQKTDFPFEILIHDDASTDKTRKIIESYAKKYPNLIRATYQTENQYSKGTKIFKNILMPQSTGEYIALCEGDDYWICDQKLARQTAVLDADPTLAVSFHDVLIRWKDKISESHIKHFNPNLIDIPSRFDLCDVANATFIVPTCSAVYRKGFNKTIELKHRYPSGDFLLWMTLGQSGDFARCDETMGVYRKTNPHAVTNNRNFIDNIITLIKRLHLFTKLRRENVIPEGFFLDCVDKETDHILSQLDVLKNHIVFKNYLKIRQWMAKIKNCD